MGWGSWKTAAGVALGLVAASVVGPVASAGAATTALVLAPGQVVTASPTSTLTAPADGRIRGSGFDATVTGVGWPAAVRVGGRTEVAGAGQRLVVFGVKVTEIVHTQTELTHVTLATATLDIGHDVLSMPLGPLDTAMRQHDFASSTPSGTAEATFAASVPAGTHHVDLVMSQANYSQRFSLWTLRRLPPDPAALYRPETGSYYVAASSKGAADIPISDPAGLSAPAAWSVRWAVLSEFSATTPTTPAPKATEAYLDVELLGTTSAEHDVPPVTDPYKFDFTTPLPGDRLTFTPTGGAPVQATLVPDRQAKGGLTDDGLFDALYDFVVPASTTAGTLSVVAGPITGEPCSYECTATTSAITLGAASVPLTFPDPPGALPKQRTPPWVGAPDPPTGTAAAGANTNEPAGSHLARAQVPTASGGFPIWLAVVLVLIVAGAAVATERVMQRQRARPAFVGGGPSVTVDGATVNATYRVDAHGREEVITDEPASADDVAPEPAAVRAIPPAGAERATDLAVLGEEGDLVVRVLGPVEITGWHPPDERRSVLEGLCTYLCLHPERPRSTEELLVAMEPVNDDRADGANKTLRNNLSRLRHAVGPQRFPEAVAAGGYRITSAVTDWGRFCGLVAAAKSPDGDGADELLTEALSHVRGVPFEGAPKGPYSWALDTGLVHQMIRAVVDAAHALSGHRLAAGDHVGAETAARLGQRASLEDFGLWHDLFAAVRAGGDLGALLRLRAEAARVLGKQMADALFEGTTPLSA